MRTIDLQIGHKYLIHELEVEIIKNDSNWEGVVISGDKKGQHVAGFHSGYCRPNGVGSECVIHKNSGCINIVEI